MNRAQRRAAAADVRRAKHDYQKFYPMSAWTDYLKHLPRIEPNAPLPPNSKIYTVEHHDPECRSLTTQRRWDCDCEPVITKCFEPVRS
jgi:hypothetical protein